MLSSQDIQSLHIEQFSEVSQKLNMRRLWPCTTHSIYQRQFFKHLYHFCPERWHDFSPMVLIFFLIIILFFKLFLLKYFGCRNARNTHRCHLVLKFKHWMLTARDDTHSLGIFMQIYGHGLSCEHTSSSRTLWLNILNSCSESQQADILRDFTMLRGRDWLYLPI